MTSDVFWGIFDLPAYPNQIIHYISLCILVKSDGARSTYLPKNLTSYGNAPSCQHVKKIPNFESRPIRKQQFEIRIDFLCADMTRKET